MVTKFLTFLFIFLVTCYGQIFFPVPIPPIPPMSPAPSGYVIINNDEDNMMNRKDLVMISPTQVGFWTLFPSGRYVLQCRAMKYDREHGEWYYGPWHEDRNMSYEKYRHSSFYNRDFHNYMNERYPKYYEKHFKDERRNDRDDKRWHNDDHDKKWHDDHDKHHDKDANDKYDDHKKRHDKDKR